MEPYPTTTPAPTTGTDRSWSAVAHLSAIIAAIVSAGWLSMVGPLIVWAINQQRPAVRASAAGAFNFNLSFWLLYVISWILIFSVLALPIGIILLVVIFLVSLWCHLKGALRSLNGRSYDYPWQIRILH